MTRRSLSPLQTLASLLGAVLYGRRPEDAAARKKLTAISASGFVVFFGYEAIRFGQEWVRHEWDAAAARQRELVVVVREVSGELKVLTAQLREDAEANAEFRGAVMERVGRR